MGECELPLGALLLIDAVTSVHCSLHRPAGAAPLPTRAAAEIVVQLRTLHVGAKCSDDAEPGVPRAWTQQLDAAHARQVAAAKRLQATWRGRPARLRDVVQDAWWGKDHLRHALHAKPAVRVEGERHATAAAKTIAAPHNNVNHLHRLQAQLRAAAEATERALRCLCLPQANSRALLLPMTVERSDAILADADLTHWKRRRQMLQVLLCLLGGCVCVLFVGLATLAIVWASLQEPDRSNGHLT